MCVISIEFVQAFPHYVTARKLVWNENDVTEYKYDVVQEVSSHSEYLENQARGLDVTWQPVRGDLTVHP